MQLALMRRYPQLYDSEKIDTAAKIRALESPLVVGETILRSIIEPPILALDVVQKGFNSEYVGHDEIVTPTIEALETWTSAWSPDIYFAPYTCIVGPSMMGKSRLLKEIAKEVCVIYICLRPKDSTGEPPRSQLATEMLGTNSSEQYYNALIAAMLHVTSDFFKKKAREKSDRAELLKEWNEHQKSIHSDFYSNVRSKLGELVVAKDSPKGLCDAVGSIHDNDFFEYTKLKVVLAIDEASALLEISPIGEVPRFREFRRSFRNIPKSAGIFAVLVDTNSRVANFLPNTRYDRSPRNIGLRGGQGLLYPPIYKIASFDVMVPSDGRPENWNDLLLPKRLCQYGVPFYSVYLKDAMASKTVVTLAIAVDEMARFALKKLLFCDDTTKTVEITDARALALLGPTIGVPLHGLARLNVELTASHAAHCGYIDPANELQYSFYPSQPIYALAANDYLYQNEDKLVLCIEALARVFSRGCVDTGEAGEYASRIILLCAMNKTVHDLKTLDKARAGTDNKAPDGMDIDSPPDDMKTLDKAPKTSNKAPNIPDSRPVELKEFPGAIPVAKFLETLTGISANTLPLGSIASKQKKRLLEEGMMHWNHFIQRKKTPTTESLMEGLHRGVAMQCQHSQKAFDQVLTIYLKERSRDFLEPKNISFCGVQVKNVQHDTAAQKYQSLMTPENAGIDIPDVNPYLALFFDLNYSPQTVKQAQAGDPEDRVNTYQLPAQGKPDVRQASLVFYGLDAFNFLSPELKQALNKLINTKVDLLSRHPDVLGQKYAKQFLLRSDWS